MVEERTGADILGKRRPGWSVVVSTEQKTPGAGVDGDAPGVSQGFQSVQRVCGILNLVVREGRLTLGEIVEGVGLQRSTTYRYVSSLVDEDYLSRDHDGAYTTGPKLVEAGVAAVGASPIVDAGPYMRQLVEDVHHTAVLSMWGGSGAVTARVEEDETRLVHVSIRVGVPLPIDAAQSQVFLAHLQDRQMVERLLNRLPEGTRRDLEEQVARARQQGFAIADRVVDGVRAIAAPVFNATGIEATLALVGTVYAIPAESDSPLVQALFTTAYQLSLHRGHRPESSVEPREE